MKLPDSENINEWKTPGKNMQDCLSALRLSTGLWLELKARAHPQAEAMAGFK